MNCSVNPRQSISLRVREPDSYDASFYDSAPGLVTPKAFQPIPLATFAFACVAIAYTLDTMIDDPSPSFQRATKRTLNRASVGHTTFVVSPYNLLYDEYMNALRKFQKDFCSDFQQQQELIWRDVRKRYNIPDDEDGTDLKGIALLTDMGEQEFNDLFAAAGGTSLEQLDCEGEEDV